MECHTNDVPMHGYQFTWERGRGTLDSVEEKLDKATMASREWHRKFQGAFVLNNEDAPASDHYALILCTKKRVDLRKHSFRFENAWTRDEDCRNLISESWNQLSTSDAQERIHKYAMNLEAWSSDKRKQFRQKNFGCQNSIKALKGRIYDDSVRQLEEARGDLNEILVGQETYWRKRAK